MGISRSLLFLVESYFCCMDAVSRLEDREKVKWGGKEGKQMETSIKADKVLEAGLAEKGQGRLWKPGGGKLEAPGAVLWWPPYQAHLQLH